jgi:multidrug efflux system outer membrane protein
MDTDPVLQITCNRFPARDDLRDITRRNTGFVAARRMERRMSIKKQVTVNAALRRGKYLGAIGAALLLGGCVAVGPDYRPPTLDAPPQWQSTLTNEQAAGSMDSAVLSRWWANLGDPVLTTLMEQALAGNLDLDQARHRVREARASRMGASAGYFPEVDGSAAGRKSRSSEETGTGMERKLYSAAFDAQWELDLFGGVRRAVEASQADLEASQADLDDVRVTLLAEVAVNYSDVRTYQARLAVSRDNVALQQQTLDILEALFEAGTGDALSVEQARYNLESSRAGVPGLKTGLAAALNRIAVLTGRTPGAAHAELSEVKPLPRASLELAVGVPADTLRRRPDVRRAERELAAQTARVGVATADLYPKLTLSGTIGLEALSLDNLLQTSSRTWGFGPAVSWTIFDAGAIRANIQVQSERQAQALGAYEATVLEALEEVENAITAYAQEQEKLVALSRAAAAARDAADLAARQYVAGAVSFNTVLEAQRSQLSFEDQRVQSQGAVLADLVRLYKALGGGWNPQEPDPMAQRTDKVKVSANENRNGNEH